VCVCVFACVCVHDAVFGGVSDTIATFVR
jgi:hypothetical protein